MLFISSRKNKTVIKHSYLNSFYFHVNVSIGIVQKIEFEIQCWVACSTPPQAGLRVVLGEDRIWNVQPSKRREKWFWTTRLCVCLSSSFVGCVREICVKNTKYSHKLFVQVLVAERTVSNRTCDSDLLDITSKNEHEVCQKGLWLIMKSLMGDVCGAVNATRTIASISRTSTTTLGDINNSHGEPWERSGRRRLSALNAKKPRKTHLFWLQKPRASKKTKIKTRRVNYLRS